MRSLSSSFLALSVALAACGAPATSTTLTPAPVAAPPIESAAPSAAVRIPAVTMSEPPKNWQLLDATTDHVPGISAERAMNELLRGKTQWIQDKGAVLSVLLQNAAARKTRFAPPRIERDRVRRVPQGVPVEYLADPRTGAE